MKKEESFRIFSPSEIEIHDWDIKGEEYRRIMRKVEKIIRYQKKYAIKKGIKGFIFYGDVGLGKTTVAKAIANRLSSYLFFVDGKDIARPLYGEAEDQIGKIFRSANIGKHTLILIDDCESVFPARDWAKGASWHVAQNNVFFHELDGLDTSKIAVILTTNRYDLLDKAIKDRLMSIEFPKPTKETLKEIAVEKQKELKLKDIDPVMLEIKDGKYETIRSLEKRIMELYVRQIAGGSELDE